MNPTRTDAPAPGHLLHTTEGVTPIIAIDWSRQAVVTQIGSWPMEDVTRAAPPSGTDVETLEAWLAGAEWWTDTAPLQEVKVEVQACKVRNLDCECGACDASVHRVRGVEQAAYHERRNDRCRCAEKGCPCLS